MYKVEIALRVAGDELGQLWIEQMCFTAQDVDPMSLLDEAAAALATLRQRYIFKQATKLGDMPTDEMEQPSLAPPALRPWSGS